MLPAMDYGGQLHAHAIPRTSLYPASFNRSTPINASRIFQKAQIRSLSRNVCSGTCSADDPLSAGADEHKPQGKRIRLLKEIVFFSLPVLMVPLADPMMSLIDTIALGQLAGTLQLAALGPTTLIFNFAFYSFNALSIATVSLTAERIRQGKGAETAVSTALFVGAIGGVLITAVIQGWGQHLLLLTGCDASLLNESWRYLRIRSLAAPAAILTQVAQAGLLGQRDSQTPFKVVVTSIAVSLLGDVVLIGSLGMGVAGAAWTTVAAQCLSAFTLCWALRRSAVSPPVQLPELKELKALLTVASTLGVFYIAKTSSYLCLQWTATKLPTMMLAAHQPVWQLWGLCSFTNTPLEQAALAFIPAAEARSERRDLTTLILALGCAMGVLCSLVAHGVPAIRPGLLAADPALWPLMQSVALPGTLAMLCCGADVSATGILLASKDTGYVARSMLVSLGILGSFLWWNSIAGEAGGLVGVWWSLAVFFAARMLQSVPRVLLQHFGPPIGSGPSNAAAAAQLNARAT